VTAESVRIVVEATRSPAGRLTGLVIPAAGTDLTFSGTLELLACIEAAIDAQSPYRPPST
jgi:hypothetical protein